MYRVTVIGSWCLALTGICVTVWSWMMFLCRLAGHYTVCIHLHPLHRLPHLLDSPWPAPSPHLHNNTQAASPVESANAICQSCISPDRRLQSERAVPHLCIPVPTAQDAVSGTICWRQHLDSLDPRRLLQSADTSTASYQRCCTPHWPSLALHMQLRPVFDPLGSSLRLLPLSRRLWGKWAARLHQKVGIEKDAKERWLAAATNDMLDAETHIFLNWHYFQSCQSQFISCCRIWYWVWEQL